MRSITTAALALGASMLISGSPCTAAIIDSSQYSLTQITGSYAWGQTNNNGLSQTGYVNNVSDLATVEALMSDGYVYSDPYETINGIYNWETPGFHALTFEFNGGNDFTLDSLSFISSRNFGDTPITVDYSLDGGPWITAAATSSDTLGIATGLGAAYTIELGGVLADAFRFTTTDGSQVSLHEITIEGVPEPGSLVLLTLGGAGLFIAAQRRRTRRS